MKLESLVSKHYDELNPNDLIIWRYITQNKEHCQQLNIEALGRACNVSRSTVMRFAQKLGLSGYSELKALIRLSLEEKTPFSDNLSAMICESNIKSIQFFQSQNYDDICHMLSHANRIFMYGTGSLQRSACIEFQRMMLSLNILVNVIPAEGEVRKIVRMMNTEDVFFVVSKSGESNLLRDVMIQANGKNIKTISLTRYGNNTLAKMSLKNLFVNIEEVTILEETNFESMTLMFIILEILFAKLVEYQMRTR